MFGFKIKVFSVKWCIRRIRSAPFIDLLGHFRIDFATEFTQNNSKPFVEVINYKHKDLKTLITN
ncbi:hypothetical protein GCM10008983_20790 [Lentibacillus halophilus]|uniref:Uncharacterized protein n=1 Tax=Lentibacillus halophilus TaxID=295065 RepID=A0ABP3J6F4_9BACI